MARNFAWCHSWALQVTWDFFLLGGHGGPCFYLCVVHLSPFSAKAPAGFVYLLHPALPSDITFCPTLSNPTLPPHTPTPLPPLSCLAFQHHLLPYLVSTHAHALASTILPCLPTSPFALPYLTLPCLHTRPCSTLAGGPC